MPTQGQRQNFLWRPNDNSVTTRLRYDLEAEHWTRSFKSASAGTSVSFGEALGVVGLMLGFAVNLSIFIVCVVLDIVKFIYSKVTIANEKTEIENWIKKELIEARNTKIRTLINNRSYVDIEQRDIFFNKATTIVVEQQKVTIPLLMIELNIDHIRAGKIIDQLIAAGIITGRQGRSRRKVLIEDQMSLDMLFEIEKEYSK